MSKEEYIILQNNLESTKKEVNSLKENLSKTSEEKEQFYQQKENLRRELIDSILRLKDTKKEIDNSEKSQEEFRKKRDLFNKKFKDLIQESKRISKQKKEIIDKYDILDPNKIRQAIKDLELKIETEGFSFDKEKKIMDQIKNFKRKLSEAKIVEEILNKFDYLKKEIDLSKKEGDLFHQKFLEQINIKKQKYNDMQEFSIKTNELRRKFEDEKKNYNIKREEYGKLKNELNKKLGELDKIYMLIQVHKNQLRRIKLEKEEKILQEKFNQVEEKIKSGKKLTTEDLIVLQGKSEQS